MKKINSHLFKFFIIFQFVLLSVIFSACNPPSNPVNPNERHVVTTGSTEFNSIVAKDFLSLNEKIFKTDYDFIKFFVEGNTVTIYHDYTSPADAKSKTLSEIKTAASGTIAEIDSIEVNGKTPDTNGKMILLKTIAHTNFGDTCYEASYGTNQHDGCFIPAYISITNGEITYMEAYITSVKNPGTSGTSCFKNREAALGYLKYSCEDSWFTTTYSPLN